MRIVDLRGQDKRTVRQAAELLVEGFRDEAPEAWPTLKAALAEVNDALDDERVCRVALGDDNSVLGWVGAIPEYNGRAWELHPIVVKPGKQGQGVGKALTQDLEEQVRQRGAHTLYLGTDDESQRTSLSNVDLYENTWERIRTVKNLRRHPYEFFQKMGFTIVGVVPDANGPDKPDILMAKRVGGAR